MKYLQSNPNIARGDLTIKDTRIRISQVFRMLAAGMSLEYILEGWPWMSEKTLRGAMDEAVCRLKSSGQDVPVHA